MRLLMKMMDWLIDGQKIRDYWLIRERINAVIQRECMRRILVAHYGPDEGYRP